MNLKYVLSLFLQDNKDLELDIIPASLSDREVKLRDASHEVNEEKRKSARKKEYVPRPSQSAMMHNLKMMP